MFRPRPEGSDRAGARIFQEERTGRAKGQRQHRVGNVEDQQGGQCSQRGVRGRRTGGQGLDSCGLGFYSKCSQSLELLSSGCLCCFHSGPRHILRAALHGRTNFSTPKRRLRFREVRSLAQGNTGRTAAGTQSQACLAWKPVSLPVHQATSSGRIFSGSLQRLWAPVRGRCLPLPNPGNEEEALGCLELVSMASAHGFDSQDRRDLKIHLVQRLASSFFLFLNRGDIHIT